MSATQIHALDDGEVMVIPRAWAQWQRHGICYRQYHDDAGSTTVFAREAGTWFELRDGTWETEVPLDTYPYAYGVR